MNQVLKDIDKWHKTRKGWLLFGAFELILAYIIGSQAIDTGSWWQYLVTLILFIGAIQNFVSAVRNK